MIAPVLLVMLFGLAAYGGYFWLSHAVQQLANDAARAAVGGLTTGERQSLAASTMAAEIPAYGALAPAQTSLAVTDTGQLVTISVSYDASASPFFAVQGLVPMPSPTIVRVAAIRLGGY